MVEARPGGVTAACQARWVHQYPRLYPKLLCHRLEGIANRIRLERLQPPQGVAESGQARLVLGCEIFLRSHRVVFDLLFEIETGVGGQFTEQFDLPLARLEGSLDERGWMFLKVHSGADQG